GRDAHMNTLVETLDDMRAGKGSTWLIGAESGAGKSRLLEELRTLALVSGVLVMRGQSVSEGGQPYQVWRDPLRWPILMAEVSDLDASVLKSLVGDIGSLLQREVADAPPLDGLAAQERLYAAIENLFQKQTRPIVIVLEDLQWAGKESVDLLNRLSQRAPDL